MELSEEAVHDVIHPTAAFGTRKSIPVRNKDAEDDGPSWDMSWLNPKNRIDSLDVPNEPLWSVDGCTAFGAQYYATPLFVPEPSKLPLPIREVLNADVVFHSRDKHLISRLALTRHILRILHYWAKQMTDPTEIYRDMPFGSRILLRNMPANVADAVVMIVPAHHLEAQLRTLPSLQEHWATDIQEYPPTKDLSELGYISQLHDSTTLVQIEGKLWIFKALTSYSKYLYHELRQLLIIPPHPHIMSRPAHLITKKCSFGDKTVVLGFTLEYHIHGSLRDLVPYLQLHGKVSLEDKAKWSTQLTSALIHLRTIPGMFYPDLRTDNIVLSASGDIVMVDFEQRGVWCDFAAPEINAVEYIRMLAVDENLPSALSEKYSNILENLVPEWEFMREGEDYIWPNNGYNIAWAAFKPVEQEACEVYMLGRVLWCLFEAKSAPQRGAPWLSYPFEPVVEFPDFTRTPEPIRNLITRCTSGAQPGLSRLIVRKGNQLVLRHLEHTDRSTPEQIQETARQFWAQEIEAAEDWLAARAEGIASGNWKENYYNRPTLKDVLTDLEAFSGGLTNGGQGHG
jgi:serine/threonine protein kinase